MKRILKIVAFVLLFVGTIIVLVSANKKTAQQVMNLPIIKLNVQDEIALLTEDEIVNELKVNHLYWEGMKKSELDLIKVENFINSMNEVLTSEVYSEIGEKWYVELTTRRPIARIMLKGFTDFYIDNNFEPMKLSPYSKPKVLVFTGLDDFYRTGYSFEKIINNDSLKTILKLDQIYRISNYVCNSTFYNAQIVQVHYTKEDDFVMIPRVGGGKIIFGTALSDEEVEDKFQKLTTFYDEVVPYEGWNKYESVNLKFKDQIVAKKK